VKEEPAGPSKKKPFPKKRPGKARGGTSVSSAEFDDGEKKPTPKRFPPNKPRKKAVSTSSAEGDGAEKKPAPRRPPPKQRPKASVSGVEAESARVKNPPRKKPVVAKGRKKSTEHEAADYVSEDDNVTQTANRGGARGARGGIRGGARGGVRGGIRGGARGGIRGGPRGGIRGGPRGGPRGAMARSHVYAEDDVIHLARTPKNSVAADPGISQKAAVKRPVKPRPPRRPRVSGSTDPKLEKEKSADADVDALADKVAEAVIISATRDVEEREEVPRQQKDENDNDVTASVGNEEVNNNALVSAEGNASPKQPKANVELKGGHPPAIKVGGRRLVSSARKSSESEGKKGEVVEAPEGEEPSSPFEEEAGGDPEKSQVQVTTKTKAFANHSEMSAMQMKPSPTKDVTRMAKIHPHHPTNKHPIQQPNKKC